MTDSRFQPGALVRDKRSKVGKVAGDPEARGIDGKTVVVVPVDFWGQEVKWPENWLTLLNSDSPEALLLEQPEALAPWAEEAPLKLVALALSVGGGSGKVADIRAKLDERIPDIKWEGWWKKAPPQMRKLPEHFRIAKVGKDSEYSLLTSVDAIPDATELKSASVTDKKGATSADWKKWLLSTTHEPAPGRFPTKPVADSLAKWPAKTIEQALRRVIENTEALLFAGDLSVQVAEGWLRAVAQAALRRRETAGRDSGEAAAQVGEVLARLARMSRSRASQELLLRSGALDGETDEWRRDFLVGMWKAFDGEDVRELYLRSAVFGRQARADLAREVFIAAFVTDFSEHRYPELDRILDVVPEGERTQLLQEVIASATTAQRDDVLGYIAKSRHASGTEHFSLRLLATLALGGEQDELVKRTSKELSDAIAPRIAVEAELTFPAMSVQAELQKRQSAVLKDSAAHIEKAIADKHRELAELREAHKAELEQEREKQERLQERVETLRNQLFSGYEQSKLDIRQDTLVIVGELSQLAARQNIPSENFLRDVRAGLALALQAGDAVTLGSVGDTVTFDPLKHQSTESVRIGDSVKITASGVVVKGQKTGDRILVKAQVSGFSEKS